MPTPNFEEIAEKMETKLFALCVNKHGEIVGSSDMIQQIFKASLHQVATQSYNQGVEDSIEALKKIYQEGQGNNPIPTQAGGAIQEALEALNKLKK